MQWFGLNSFTELAKHKVLLSYFIPTPWLEIPVGFFFIKNYSLQTWEALRYLAASTQGKGSLVLMPVFFWLVQFQMKMPELFIYSFFEDSYLAKQQMPNLTYITVKEYPESVHSFLFQQGNKSPLLQSIHFLTAWMLEQHLYHFVRTDRVCI